MNRFSTAGAGIKSVAAILALLGFLATVGGPLALADHYARTGDDAGHQWHLAQSPDAPVNAQQAEQRALDSDIDLNRRFEPTAAGQVSK